MDAPTSSVAASPSDTPPVAAPPRRLALSLTLLALTAAAGLYMGYYTASIGPDPDDSNFLETVLIRSLGSQFVLGPGAIYGPFTSEHPWVLIHAPFYYRLAGLLAWPAVLQGVDVDTASLYAGRILAFVAWLGTLIVGYKLSRLDGAPRHVGYATVCLLCSAAVLAPFHVTVRPDTLGLLLQTAGAWLVARAWLDGRHVSRDLLIAYACFALAVCTKQHNVFVVLACSAGLLVGVVRGVFPLKGVLVAHAASLAILIGYFGLEEWLTGGQMIRSVFILPSQFRKLTYGGWPRVAMIFGDVVRRSLGLLAMGAACLLAGRRIFTQGNRLDAFLAVLTGVELLSMIPLCMNSTGSWYNYAIQAMLFVAILVARALPRVFAAIEPDAGLARRLAPAFVALAALLLLVDDSRLCLINYRLRTSSQAVLNRLTTNSEFSDLGRDARYFVGGPQHNRLLGRSDLSHDEWLYDSYEAVGAVEPRQNWLKKAVTSDGPIRQIIATRDDGVLPGVAESIEELGYHRAGQIGDFRVWER